MNNMMSGGLLSLGRPTHQRQMVSPAQAGGMHDFGYQRIAGALNRMPSEVAPPSIAAPVQAPVPQHMPVIQPFAGWTNSAAQPYRPQFGRYR